MSTPLATPDDLQLYLEAASINADRALLMLDLAQSLCEAVITPLPATARAIVLAVAARAFDNPTAATAETMGAYSTQRPGGLWLTRADKTQLRRLAGGGGAFSIDTMPRGVSAVQTVTSTAIGGTFRLVLAGQATAALAFNANAAAVQAALAALGIIGSGNVSVSGSWVVTFVNDLATTPVPTFTVDATSLTGGSIVVAVTTVGVYRPGQGLATWDYDYNRGRGVAIPPGY